MQLSILAPAECARVEALIASAAVPRLIPQFMRQHSDALVRDVLANYVAFVVDEALLADERPSWWTHVMQQAFTAFVRVNGLMEPVRRNVASFARLNPRRSTNRVH